MLKFGESGHPVFRVTSPLSIDQLKSKGGGKLSIHFCANQDTIETIFRIIVSVNQLSLYEQSQKCVNNVNIFMIERGNRCGRTVEFLIRAKRDQDKRAFG